MTLTRQNETVATSETHETKYFLVTKAMKNQSVAKDLRSARTLKNGVRAGKCVNLAHCTGAHLWSRYHQPRWTKIREGLPLVDT